MKRRVSERGFTLMELMVVVIIVAILATVAVNGYSKYKRNARQSEGVAAVMDIRQKQESFYATYSRYEASTNDEATFTGHPVSGQRGFYQWNEACPDPTNAWCNLGFTPPTHRTNDGNFTYFQFLTIGWAPDRTAPDPINNPNRRWLLVRARGLPSPDGKRCTVVQWTNETEDAVIMSTDALDGMDCE